MTQTAQATPASSLPDARTADPLVAQPRGREEDRLAEGEPAQDAPVAGLW